MGVGKYDVDFSAVRHENGHIQLHGRKKMLYRHEEDLVLEKAAPGYKPTTGAGSDTLHANVNVDLPDEMCGLPHSCCRLATACEHVTFFRGTLVAFLLPKITWRVRS